ncbi:MAG: carbonic anhydrase [Pseudomonadota bacterium]
MQSILKGVLDFQQGAYRDHASLFTALAHGQSPDVMFIGCADSRVDPNALTQSLPGELFVCRNAGNIVPPHSHHACGETASLEYALAVLGVSHIIVCGHSDCGAMKGALNPDALHDLPHVHDWIDHSRAAVEAVRAVKGKADIEDLDAVIEQNVILQLRHIRTHPVAAARIAGGQLTLHGWVFDIGSGTVIAYDDHSNGFLPIAERYADLSATAAASS